MSKRPSHRARAVLSALLQACKAARTSDFTYASEWLGWLPFGAYHWVDAGDQKGVERDFPADWSEKDLDALVSAGCLERLEVIEGEGDDVEVRFRVTELGEKFGRASRARARPPAPPTESAPPSPKPREKVAASPARATGFEEWCYECGRTITDPGEWSVGMCLPCSIERSSEIMDMD